MKFALDYNRLYVLEAEHSGTTWRIRLDVPEGTSASFITNLTQLLHIKDSSAQKHYFNEQRECVFEGGDDAKIFVDDHRFGKIFLEKGELKKKRKDFLTVSETRLIGEMPEGKGAVHTNRGDGRAKGKIFTDFHTHSSSEISGKDLVQLAQEVDASYPLRLLKEIGIQPGGRAPVQAARVWFPPLEPNRNAIPPYEPALPVAALTPPEREKLANALNVRAHCQNTTGEMELDYYRMRYPLAKHPEIFRRLWSKIAQEYKANGIEYAEITISTPDAEQLKILHEELPAIEKETGVRMRFLVGMPRTLPREKLHEIIEKAKVLSESPYFVGLDIIGYEVNKIEDFDAELVALAQWIKANDPEFTLRVHAGENAKNLENVADVLKIVETYDVRTRIGHAVYGVNSSDSAMQLARKLARKGNLVLEFNIDSNLALNNIDTLATIPFGEYVKHHVPFVVSSDGNGFYQTSARQLEKDLEHQGLGKEAYEALKSTQKDLMKRQLAYGDEKFKKVKKAYGGDSGARMAALAASLSDKCAAISAPQSPLREDLPPSLLLNPDIELVETEALPPLLGNRQPVLLFGASGTSWGRISKEQKKEAAIAVDMLVHMLNPDMVFFVLGRAKNEGLSKVLENALQSVRSEKEYSGKTPPFYVMSLLTPHAIAEPENISVHLNYIMPIENNFVALVKRLVDFAKQHQGEMIGIGGAAFSRDVILKARHEGVDFQVMSNVEGATREKAAMLEPRQRAENAKDLLLHIFSEHQDWFREGVVEQVDSFYEKAEKRYEKGRSHVEKMEDSKPVRHTRA